jgi:hypothetical protein
MMFIDLSDGCWNRVMWMEILFLRAKMQKGVDEVGEDDDE